MSNLKFFSERELVKYRKANYWRGFIACLIAVVLPTLLFFTHIINKLLDLLV